MKHYSVFLRRRKFLLWIIALLMFILYIYKYIDKNVRPSIIAISEVRAKQVTIQAINDTIKNKIKNDIEYTDLINVKYDNEGKVTLMQANTILMNIIAADVALDIQEELKEISDSVIKVPLNNVFNIQIVKLPSIRIRIIPQGAVAVDFATEFESTGINQTRHRIYIIVNTDIKMIFPLVSENIRVTTNIPIAETIIVGEVPDQFVEVPEEGILDVTQ
ncbi:MAG TPA: sporulation protein YunB [Tissierellia bacterium]|nr:sporulation protein YunB [Tissierellia bacterium]